MQHHLSSFTESSFRLGMGIILFASLAACRPRRDASDISIRSKTTYSGTVNGSAINVDVLATIHTGRGGNSACTFANLPTGFNPATLGTLT